MKTFRFDQNNSGGYYIGPKTVEIRAVDLEAATAELRATQSQSFCSCCGPRWFTGVEIADDGDELDEIDEEIEDYVPPAVDPRSATLAERIRTVMSAPGNHAWRLVDPRTREYNLNYNEPVEGSVLRVRWDRMPHNYANEEGSDVDAIARDLYGVLQTCARERISPGADAYDAGYPVWVGDRKVLWNDLVDWMPAPPPPPPDPLEEIRDQAQDVCDEDLGAWAAELLGLDPAKTAVLRAILDGVDRRAMVRCGYEA